MPQKQQAPPPPTGFTGEVPHPGVGQRMHDHFRKRRASRRAAKQARPPRPFITINTGPTGQRRAGGPRPRKYSRRRRKGMLAAGLGITFAALAVTAAVVEFGMWELAAELGTAASVVSFGTAWFFGDPNPTQPTPPKKPRQPAAQQGSGGHKCGAPTQDGSGCQRPVKTASDHCWEHPGGKGNPKAKTPTKRTQNAGPKTRKGKAAPMAPPASTP